MRTTTLFTAICCAVIFLATATGRTKPLIYCSEANPETARNMLQDAGIENLQTKI